MKTTSKVEHDFLFPIFRCNRQLRDLEYNIKFKNKIDNSLLNCDILCVLSTCVRHHGKDSDYMDALRKISESSKLTYFFDISDSCGVLYETGFEIGDVYCKKQIYFDRSYYTDVNALEPRMHFDYQLKKNSIKTYSDNIPKNYSHLSKNYINRIKISWNLGQGDYRTFPLPSKTALRSIIRLQTEIFRKPINFPALRNRYFFGEYSNRNVDLLSCFGSYDNISKPIFLHRKESSDIASSLSHKFKVVSGFHSVSDFHQLLRKSKMALAPFGWAEINWKDFEIFMNGIVLLKPDMSHVETWPDYYIEKETYLPYRWDAADLKDLIERVLSDNNYIEEIARTGQDRFISFNVRNNSFPFIGRFNQIFQ